VRVRKRHLVTAIFIAALSFGGTFGDCDGSGHNNSSFPAPPGDGAFGASGGSGAVTTTGAVTTGSGTIVMTTTPPTTGSRKR